MAEQDFDIFLAHNSDDKPKIRAISHGLRRRGLKPWLDEEQILAGQSFQKVLQTAIPCVRAATVLIGQTGLGNWQEEEVQLLFNSCKKANKPLFLTLLPGVDEVPIELGFLEQKHWVSFRNGVHKALHDMESGVRGAPAAPFFDILFCFNGEDVAEVRGIEKHLEEAQLHPWKEGLNASALQLSVLRELDKDFERISSLAVFVGRDSGPWEQDIVADLILEFREHHRPVIPIILTSANEKPKLPVYLKRLGYIDLRDGATETLDRLTFGITGKEGSISILKHSNL